MLTKPTATEGASDDSTHESIMSMSLSSLEPQKPQRNNITVKPASSIAENKSSGHTTNGEPKPRSARPKRQIRKQKTFAGLTLSEMETTEAPDLSEYQQLRANALKALQESREMMSVELPSRQEFGGKSVKDILEEEKTEKLSLTEDTDDYKNGNKPDNDTIKLNGNASLHTQSDHQSLEEPEPSEEHKDHQEHQEHQDTSEQPSEPGTSSNQGLTRQQRRERLRKQASNPGAPSNERPQDLQVSSENQAAEDREVRRQRRQQLRRQGIHLYTSICITI